MPSEAIWRSSTTVASRCAKVVAGEGSVRSSAGTSTAWIEVIEPVLVEVNANDGEGALVAPVGPLPAVDAAALERNLAVNLVAPMLLMSRFLRATAAVPLRRIINISSGAGRRPIAGWSAYCAAKAAIIGFTRALAWEATPKGVRVNAIAPGVILTEGVIAGTGSRDAAVAATAPLIARTAVGRIGEPGQQGVRAALSRPARQDRRRLRADAQDIST